jgi:hypothetical protein
MTDEVQPVNNDAQKGNRTQGRAYLNAGPGNPAFRHHVTLPKEKAQAVVDQIHAESTYNDWANHQAMGHLTALHQHLDNLAQATDNHRIVRLAQSKVAAAHEAASSTGLAGAVDYGAGTSEKGPTAYTAVPSVLDMLHNIRNGGTELSDAAHEHLDKSIESAQSYVDTFQPAGFAPYKAHGVDPNTRTVMVEPNYKRQQFDYPDNTPAANRVPEKTPTTVISAPEGKPLEQWAGKSLSVDSQLRQTPEGKRVLIAQGKMKDPEASRSPESIAAKKAARKAKTEAEKAAKAGK